MNELFVIALWAAYAAHNVFSARLAPVMKKLRQGLLPVTLLLIGFAPFSQAHSMQGPMPNGAAAREQARSPEVFRDEISLDEAVRRAEAQ